VLSALFAVFKDAYLKRNYTLYIVLVFFPVALSFGIERIFSYDKPQHLAVGVVVEENSRLANRILKGIDADPSLYIAKYCKDIADCGSAMRAGEIYGVVILPAELERRALRHDAPAISVYTNAQSMLTSKLITNEMRSVVGTQAAILEPRNLPDPLTAEMHLIGNPTMTYETFLGIGLVAAFFHVCAMIFGAYIFSYPIREKCVTRWMECAKHSTVIAVLGRFIPAVIIYWVEMLIMMGFARRNLPPMESMDYTVFALGCLGMIAVCVAAGGAFVGITGQMQLSTGSAAVAGGPAFAFCGQTFPLFAMPVAVRGFAYLLPITHFMQLQSALLIGHVGIDRALGSLQLLGGANAFWLLLAITTLAWRLKRCVKKEKEQCEA
jgi:ABC-2 type transport system permease protein